MPEVPLEGALPEGVLGPHPAPEGSSIDGAGDPAPEESRREGARCQFPFKLGPESSLLRNQKLAECMMDFSIQQYNREERARKLLEDAIGNIFPHLFSVSYLSFLALLSSFSLMANIFLDADRCRGPPDQGLLP